MKLEILKTGENKNSKYWHCLFHHTTTTKYKRKEVKSTKEVIWYYCKGWRVKPGRTLFIERKFKGLLS